jgi:hypothetical protein
MFFKIPNCAYQSRQKMLSNRVFHFPRSCLFLSILVLIAMLALGACSGNEDEASLVTNRPAQSSLAIKDSLPASPFAHALSSSEQTIADVENGRTMRNAEQIARLRKLPHLSRMSERDLLNLQNQLRQTPLSQRSSLLKKYSSLVGLPTQQQQLLLGQLAEIVPDATPAMRVVCACKTGPKHEMCIKEECGETATLSSMCEGLCGATNISSTSCMPSTQCADK